MLMTLFSLVEEKVMKKKGNTCFRHLGKWSTCPFSNRL